jgi:hypothetical protein
LASKAEIIDAIQAGINKAESTFGQLTEDLLDTQVHEEPGGWTARQVLAHLAGRQEMYDLLIDMAMKTNGMPPGGFDVDTWNHRLVRQREGLDRDELLREFRQVHEDLIERTKTFREDQLKLPIILPNRETNLGDVLLGSGGMHSIQHASDVESALDLPS